VGGIGWGFWGPWVGCVGVRLVLIEWWDWWWICVLLVGFSAGGVGWIAMSVVAWLWIARVRCVGGGGVAVVLVRRFGCGGG